MRENDADKGRLTSDGVYQPLGKYGVPGGVTAGTGPFKLDSWRIGDKLELERNDDYWGRKAGLTRLIFRAIPDNAARLQALQTGEIDGYDLVEPQDIRTLRRNEDLKVLDRDAFNVGYVGINQQVEAVRQRARPPSARARSRQSRGRTIVLRGPRSGGEGVHATRASLATRTASRSIRTTRRGHVPCFSRQASSFRSRSSTGGRRTSRVRTCRTRRITSRRSLRA